MKQHSGTAFVLCSSTNEPRIRAMDEACKTAGRIPCHDLFLTTVRGELGWQDSCVPKHFVASYVDVQKLPRAHQHFMRYYEKRELVSAVALAKSPDPLTVFVRTSMLSFMEKFLTERKERDGVLFYSMWAGYKETEPVKRLLDFCVEHKIEVVDLHCSGHAYAKAVKALIWQLNPTVLIPIHCDKSSRNKFSKLHPNCVMLVDGELLELKGSY